VIVTVTPNPAVDRTVFVDALRLGTITHGARSWSEPSGKGVNVALALQAHQRPTVAVLPVGGPAGAHLVEMLERAGLDYEAVAIAGEVRVNISIVQPDGVVTKINERGPRCRTPRVTRSSRRRAPGRERAAGSRAAAACPAASPTGSTPGSSRQATAQAPAW